SNDGGISFANIPVSESSFTPWSSVFFGDYIGIDSFDGTIQTTWMSMDEGDLSVWLAKLTFISGLDPEHQENGVRVEQSVVMKVPSTTGSQQTRIAFTTYHNGPVNLSVYDLRGHRVQSLVSEHRPAGSYSEMWDGSNSRSQRVSSGMYLIRLQAGSETVTRKVVINN
ncbi:MAG: T9SS type A sorting domain-containing protein, partial [bacterium]|nr:T9SS type A sorting domain-containing protein [bacterium]